MIIIMPEDYTDEIKPHPYVGSTYDDTVQYYDFKQNPELIPQVLEDFVPYNNYDAIQSFYQFLEWVNSADSILESSDCAFQPAEDYTDSTLVNFTQRCSGRVMLLYRNLPLNLNYQVVEQMQQAFRFYFGQPEYSHDALKVGLRLFAARYLNLEYQVGHQLTIQFASYGNSEMDVMNNLNVFMNNLISVSKTVNADLEKFIG